MINIFLEFLEALQNHQSFRIFFQVFKNPPELPEIAKHFSSISRSPKKSPKLQNIFQAFINTPVLPEVAKYFSRITRSPKKSPKFQNIFSSIYKYSSTF